MRLLMTAVLLAGCAVSESPDSPEALLVRDFLLENADDPKTVEVVSWGPHDLKDTTGLGKALAQAHKLPEGTTIAIVRVRYRAGGGKSRQLYDYLYFVQDGKKVMKGPLWVIPTPDGDDWRETVKRRYGGSSKEK